MRLEDVRAVQLDLFTRRQAKACEFTRGQIDQRLRSGRWISVLTGVLAFPGTPLDHAHLLLAACLARPAVVASHESAAWLWELMDEPPRQPTVSISRRGYHGPLGPVLVRQVTDLPGAHAVTHRSTPVTNPLRTIVDLAGVVGEKDLDRAVDRALATRLLTAEGLEAEIGRLARPGRRGVNVLRRALRRRGLIGVPAPSVLESHLLRLLHRANIEPAGIEVTVLGDSGRYRLDTMLLPGLGLEVDGYAHHGQADDLMSDNHRHNDLLRQQVFALHYTWTDVVDHPAATIADIRATMAIWKERDTTKGREAAEGRDPPPCATMEP